MRRLLAAFAILAVVASHATAALTRGPFIENPTNSNTSVVISWWTDVAGDGTVEYGKTVTYGSFVTQAQQGSCEVGSAGLCHFVTLTGLAPGELYHYQIRHGGIGGTVIQTDQTFRAFRAANDKATVHFAVIGDWGKTPPGTEEGQIAALINTANPDFLMTVGDNFYDTGTQAELDQSMAVYQNAVRHMLFFPVYGNHDLVAATWNNSAQFKTFRVPTNGTEVERYYSFDNGNAHFVALDSSACCSTAQGPICNNACLSAMKTWLDNDLATTTRKWKFVFMHHIPYGCASGAAAFDSDVTVLRPQLAPIFEKHKVDTVFFGHDHSYERSLPVDDYLTSGSAGSDGNSTRYVQTGGGGSVLDGAATIVGGLPRDKSNQLCYWLAKQCPTGAGGYCSIANYHYTSVKIVNDETVIAQAINNSGTVIDTWGFSKAGTVYFVDPSAGNNANAGTSPALALRNTPGTRTAANGANLFSTAWAASTITAASKVPCGSSFLFKPNTTHASTTGGGALVFSSQTPEFWPASCSDDRPLVVRPARVDEWAGATAGKVTFDGTSIENWNPTSGGCIGGGYCGVVSINNVSNFSFIGNDASLGRFHITNVKKPSAGAQTNGITVDGSFLTFRNLQIGNVEITNKLVDLDWGGCIDLGNLQQFVIHDFECHNWNGPGIGINFLTEFRKTGGFGIVRANIYDIGPVSSTAPNVQWDAFALQGLWEPANIPGGGGAWVLDSKAHDLRWNGHNNGGTNSAGRWGLVRFKNTEFYVAGINTSVNSAKTLSESSGDANPSAPSNTGTALPEQSTVYLYSTFYRGNLTGVATAHGAGAVFGYNNTMFNAGGGNGSISHDLCANSTEWNNSIVAGGPNGSKRLMSINEACGRSCVGGVFGAGCGVPKSAGCSCTTNSECASNDCRKEADNRFVPYMENNRLWASGGASAAYNVSLFDTFCTNTVTIGNGTTTGTTGKRCRLQSDCLAGEGQCQMFDKRVDCSGCPSFCPANFQCSSYTVPPGYLVGAGNVVSGAPADDPQFVNVAGTCDNAFPGDYLACDLRLKSSSPAIDKGLSPYLLTNGGGVNSDVVTVKPPHAPLYQWGTGYVRPGGLGGAPLNWPGGVHPNWGDPRLFFVAQDSFYKAKEIYGCDVVQIKNMSCPATPVNLGSTERACVVSMNATQIMLDRQCSWQGDAFVHDEWTGLWPDQGAREFGIGGGAPQGIFIDPVAGNDANDGGSPTTPLRTPPGTRAANSATAVLRPTGWGPWNTTNKVPCGTTLYLRPNRTQTSTEGGAWMFDPDYYASTCTSGNPIVLRIATPTQWTGASAGKFILDGTGVTLGFGNFGWGSHPALVYVAGLDNFEMRGISTTETINIKNSSGRTLMHGCPSCGSADPMIGFHARYVELSDSVRGGGICNADYWSVFDSPAHDLTGGSGWEVGCNNDHFNDRGAFVRSDVYNVGSMTALGGSQDGMFYVGSRSVWTLHGKVHHNRQRGINTGCIFGPSCNFNARYKFRGMDIYDNGLSCGVTTKCTGGANYDQACGVTPTGGTCQVPAVNCPAGTTCPFNGSTQCSNHALCPGAICGPLFCLGAGIDGSWEHDAPGNARLVLQNSVLFHNRDGGFGGYVWQFTDAMNLTTYRTNYNRSDLGSFLWDSTGETFNVINHVDKQESGFKLWSTNDSCPGSSGNCPAIGDFCRQPDARNSCWRPTVDTNALGPTHSVCPALVGGTYASPQSFYLGKGNRIGTSNCNPNFTAEHASDRAQFNPTPAAGSTLIDGGRPWMLVSTAATGVNTIQVKSNGASSDPRDIFLIRLGAVSFKYSDELQAIDGQVQIGNGCGVRNITAMTANSITFDGAPCTVLVDTPVTYPYQGNANDIGCCESGAAPPTTTSTIAPATTSTTTTTSTTIVASSTSTATTTTTSSTMSIGTGSGGMQGNGVTQFVELPETEPCW